MKKILLTMAISFFAVNAHSAGSPLNEDFTALLATTAKVKEAAAKKDSLGVIESATECVSIAKDQGIKGSSHGLQKVMERCKGAKKAAKANDFAKVEELMGEADTEMNKPKQKPNFGGGSEQTNYKF